MTISLRPYVFEAGEGRAIEAEMGSLTVPMNRSAVGRRQAPRSFVAVPARKIFRTRDGGYLPVGGA